MDGAIEFLLQTIAEQLSLSTNHKNSLFTKPRTLSAGNLSLQCDDHGKCQSNLLLIPY